MRVGKDTTVNSVNISGDIDVSATGDAQIQPSVVTTAEILDETITTDDILNETIAAVDIATGAVTTSEILNETILAEDIATGAVTTDKILDLTIVNADVSNTAAIAISKLASGAPAQVIVGAAVTGVPTYVDMTGDVHIDNLGATTIQPDAVGSAEIINESITTNDILNGTIANVDLDKANIPLSGFGAAAAPVDLGNQNIINLLDPVNPQDGATKNYVDLAVDADNDLDYGHIWVGDITNNQSMVDASGLGYMLVGDGTTLHSVLITGDVEVAADGTLTIQPDAVTRTGILDETTTPEDILNETIAAVDIGTGAVTSDEI